MTNPEIITIIAIVSSSLFSIISLIISHLNTKVTVQSKRSEIALEKRLESFKEIIEEIGKIKLLFSQLLESIRNNDDVEFQKINSFLNTSSLIFYHKYHSNSVFLPPNIFQLVNKFGHHLFKFRSEDMNIDLHEEWLKLCKEKEEKIVSEMQLFIGYD